MLAAADPGLNAQRGERGEYRCGRCGQLKKGHWCTAAAAGGPATLALPLPRVEKRIRTLSFDVPDADDDVLRATPLPKYAVLPPPATTFSFPAGKQLCNAEEKLLSRISHLRLLSFEIAKRLPAPASATPRACAVLQKIAKCEDAHWLLNLHAIGRNGVLCTEQQSPGASGAHGRDGGCGGDKRIGEMIVQVIVSLAYLRAGGTQGPFLVCVPPSRIELWRALFGSVAPSIPVARWLRSAAETAGDLGAGVEKRPTPDNARAEEAGDLRRMAVVLITHSEACAEARHLRAIPWELSVVDAADCTDWQEILALTRRVARLHPGNSRAYFGASSFLLAAVPPPGQLPVLWALQELLLLPQRANEDGDHNVDVLEDALIGRAGARKLLEPRDEAALVAELQVLLAPCVRQRRAPLAHVSLEPISELEALASLLDGE